MSSDGVNNNSNDNNGGVETGAKNFIFIFRVNLLVVFVEIAQSDLSKKTCVVCFIDDPKKKKGS